MSGRDEPEASGGLAPGHRDREPPPSDDVTQGDVREQRPKSTRASTSFMRPARNSSIIATGPPKMVIHAINAHECRARRGWRRRLACSEHQPSAVGPAPRHVKPRRPPRRPPDPPKPTTGFKTSEDRDPRRRRISRRRKPLENPRSLAAARITSRVHRGFETASNVTRRAGTDARTRSSPAPRRSTTNRTRPREGQAASSRGSRCTRRSTRPPEWRTVAVPHAADRAENDQQQPPSDDPPAARVQCCTT